MVPSQQTSRFELLTVLNKYSRFGSGSGFDGVPLRPVESVDIGTHHTLRDFSRNVRALGCIVTLFCWAAGIRDRLRKYGGWLEQPVDRFC
jgi:hypothetical protein